MSIKDYAQNLATNLLTLTLFIYGNLGTDSGAKSSLYASIGIYVIMFVLAAIFAFFDWSKFIERKQNLNQINQTIQIVSKAMNKNYIWFNVIEDAIIAGIISWFGYDLLAVLYALHIIGYVAMYWNIKQYVLAQYGDPDSWEILPKNLFEALDENQTEFYLKDLLSKEKK